MQWREHFHPARLLGFLEPGTASSCSSWCFSIPFWVLAPGGGVVGRVQRKTQRCRGTEELLAGLEKLGVIQAPGCANTPPSGLEGGVGRRTRYFAFCFRPKAPWCLVSGWGEPSLVHKWDGVNVQESALSACHRSLASSLSPHQPLIHWVRGDEDRAWKPPRTSTHPPAGWPLGSETCCFLPLAPHLGNGFRPQFPTQPHFAL